MATTKTWLIIAGFVLLVLGFALRTILMMRSSDATPREAPSRTDANCCGNINGYFRTARRPR